MQAHHTTRGCLAVEWHLGVGGISLLNFCNAYSSLHGNNHCPLRGDVYGSLPGHICQCRDLPQQQQVPVPSSYPTRCHRLLAMISLLNFCNAYSSLHGNNHCPLPGDVYGLPPGKICQCPAWALWQSLPGTLASSLPGNTCQFPACECLPVCMRMPCACPAWACRFPCLGTLASPLPGNACQFPAWKRLETLETPGNAWKPGMPGNACQFPACERLLVPCLGTLASVHGLAWHASSPCLGRLPVPCLGTLDSYLPGNVCHVQSPGTFCSPCLGHFASSLPGHVCQCPAWSCLPFPAWDACQFPAWERHLLGRHP